MELHRKGSATWAAAWAAGLFSELVTQQHMDKFNEKKACIIVSPRNDTNEIMGVLLS